jgi:hypothetical protein
MESNLLKQIIKEQLIVEKRIGQISSKIEVIFSFDVDRTTHAYDRKTRDDIELYDEREISNSEINEVISFAKKEIAECIVNGEITEDTNFVVRSSKWGLAIAIIAKHIGGTYWKLLVRTVFRESNLNPFRVGRDQLVIDV